MATKQYKNTSDKDINIPTVGLIEAGQTVSLSGEHLPAIIVENFPGLVDTTDFVEDVADVTSQVDAGEEETPAEDATEPTTEPTEVPSE